MLVLLVSCSSFDINFSAPVMGKYDRVNIVEKSFIVIDIISITSTETHKNGPLGINRNIEGSVINYTDLMMEAARLEADDIIDVRIDLNSTGSQATFWDRIRGWEQTITYFGTALAIKYTDEEMPGDSPLSDVFHR